MRDDLGNRMKEQYENRTRYYLPRRTYTIIRIDGKAFHTYCRVTTRLKPFDDKLSSSFDRTAYDLVKEIQNARFAYTQSDEISLLLTDFATDSTEQWLDGNVQKICSVAASIATARFYQYFAEDAPGLKGKYGLFDARVFTVPDPTEVENYFIWRQKDAVRNSIQS